MMKRYFLFVLALLVFSPFSHAAITQNFDGVIEQLDVNEDGNDDLTVSLQSFEITNAGEVSVAGSAVGIQWFLLVFDTEGAEIGYAHFGSPTLTMNLDAGDYQFAIGGFLFDANDALNGFTSNKGLDEVGFTGAANSVAWNVTVVSPGLEVPLPAALPLFMSSLCGLLVLRRRQKA